MSNEQIDNYISENYTIDENGLIQRVACYIRVSTQEQKLHGLSLNAQRDTLKRYAEEHGVKIVEWYEDEGVSGRKLIRRRPALQRMLHDAQAGKFDRIIFIKLDRYFRSVGEYYECQKILDTHKITWTATEERYDLTSASGRYWVTQKLAMAEYEADNTGERIKLVNEYKIRTGQPLTGAQSQGLAYTVVKDTETGLKKVIPDPETKEACMDYINHFLQFQNKSHAHEYVNAKHGTNYSYNSLAKILIDSKIWGHYKGNDFYCEPYITREQFDKIQDALNVNIKQTSTDRIYLFTGLITCPQCGRKMTSCFSGKQTCRNKYGDPNKVWHYNRPYYTYRCNNYNVNKTCSYNRRPNENKLEKNLLTYFEQYITGHIENVKIADSRRKNTHVAETIKSIKTEMTRLNNMYRKNRITDAEYDKDYEELETRLKASESQLEPFLERDLTIYENLLKTDWKAIYEALDREHRRAFWRKYIKRIELDNKGHLKSVIFF